MYMRNFDQSVPEAKELTTGDFSANFTPASSSL
jgi:hypothetical protein